MRSGALFVALTTGLLPASVLGAAINPPSAPTCSVESILEYFTCRRHISEGCFDNLAEQATAWCSSYLSIAPVTVYATAPAVTLVSTETVTETTVAATTTSTEVDITTVEVPETATVTGVVESTITETITLSNGGVSIQKRVLTITSESVSATATATATATASNTVSVAPGCIDLAHKNLLRHPAARLSSACSCLDPKPTTITLDATATAVTVATETVTDVSTVTDVEPETTVSTELVTTVVATQDVTVTETSTATATVSPPAAADDACAASYNSASALRMQASALVSSPGAATPSACCQLCQRTAGCILALFPAGGQCGLFVSTGSKAGQCPGNVGFFPDTTGPVEGGSLFKGPCWAPGH